MHILPQFHQLPSLTQDIFRCIGVSRTSKKPGTCLWQRPWSEELSLTRTVSSHLNGDIIEVGWTLVVQFTKSLHRLQSSHIIAK